LEGIFNYTLSTIGTCSTPSNFTGTITVGGGLVIPGGSNIQNSCKGDNINPIVYNIVGDSATVTGLPNGITGSLTSVGNPSVFTISGAGTLEGIFNYTLSTIGTCSTPSNFTGTITVGGGLVIPGGSNIQNSCINTQITPIKYIIVGDSADVSGLPGGVSGKMTTKGSLGIFTISGTPTISGVYTYTVITKGSCGSHSSFTGILTVNEAKISLTSAPGSNAQKICRNIPITNITYLIGDTGTKPNISPNLPTDLISNYTGGILTISGTPNVAKGTYSYTITPTGTCINNTAIFTITIISPIAKFTADPPQGSPPLFVNFTNESSNANVYNWTFGDGNTSKVYDSNNTFTRLGVYTVQLIVSANLECPDTAKTTITVYDMAIPNVFTPNGDGINDIFTINPTGVGSFNIEIYNRWETKVYEWHLPEGGWDGHNNATGLICENGTYYYIVKEKDILGKEFEKTGFITLIK
jgi:gliding motility-associated-like protein